MTGPIFSGALIEKVQHLSFAFSFTNGLFESVDCTLGVDAGVAVDYNRALLFQNYEAAGNWQGDTSANLLDSAFLYLVDADTVRCEGDPDATGNTTLHFQLVEFYSGMFKKIHRGLATPAPHATTSAWTETEIDIGATVNIAKSFLIVDFNFGTGWQAINNVQYNVANQAYLKSTGDKWIWRSDRNATAAASTYKIPWTILEGY